MADDLQNDRLSSSTARLSISAIDGDITTIQIQEAIKNSNNVSNSIKEPSPNKENGEMTSSSKDATPELPSTESNRRNRRRRRSSGQPLSVSQGEKTILAGVLGKGEVVHKKKQKKASQPPDLTLIPRDDLGDKKLPLRAFRELILNVFDTGGRSPSWYKLTNPKNIPQLVFCHVPGFKSEQFGFNEDENHSQFSSVESLKIDPELTFFSKNWGRLAQTTNPGSKDSIYPPLQSILSIPLSRNEKKALLTESAQRKITITDLLMSEQELIQQNYPVHIDLTENQDWVETKPFEHEGSTIFAIDCEFCSADCGKVLTRVSVVNFQGETILDSFVKPKEEIIDYLTKFSGITAEKLKNVTTTIHDIQKKILELVSSTDVLIGHSLQFDLNVMKIKHNRIVDTSVIYEHVKGPPLKPSLKWLASTFLKRVIQAGESNGDGHSSIEDATACLDLVKLKIQEGMLFGTNVGGMSIFQKLAKSGYTGDYEKFESLYLRYNQYDNQDPYQEHESHNVQYVYVKNDDEIVKKFQSDQKGKRFIVMNLREIELASKWCHIPSDYSGKVYEDESSAATEPYINTNNRLQTIYDELPDYSLMIVHSTTGDPRGMNKLLEVKRHFNQLERNGVDVAKLNPEESWDINKQQKLMEATEAARDSLTFVAMKLPKDQTK